MAQGTDGLLGAPEQAGTFVSPKGLTRRLTTAAAGSAAPGVTTGMAVAGAVLAGPWEGAPPFGTVGYLAVTANEVALVRGKMGMFKPKVGSDVVGRVARGDVVSVELEPQTIKAALRIGFADGGWWEFEVPKVHRKTAAQVAHALTVAQ